LSLSFIFRWAPIPVSHPPEPEKKKRKLPNNKVIMVALAKQREKGFKARGARDYCATSKLARRRIQKSARLRREKNGGRREASSWVNSN